jgi:hypothetical protein
MRVEDTPVAVGSAAFFNVRKSIEIEKYLSNRFRNIE